MKGLIAMLPLITACGASPALEIDSGHPGGADAAGEKDADVSPDAAPANIGPPPGSWELSWHDEFDGPTGTLPDPSRWTAETGGDGWGNNQLEYNTGRVENVSLSGAGQLAITARQEPYGGRSYTSGRLVTRGHFEQTYGYFEARIRFPSGRGLWPAFWLLGDNIGSVSWPECGEIDVVEFKGQEPALIHGTVHGPGYSGGNGVGVPYSVAGGNLDQGFHLYSVEWSPNRIIWRVDRVPFFEINPSNVGRWVFDHDFFLILNVAVGGNFVGSPDSSTSFPQTMLVDYVRAYKAAP